MRHNYQPFDRELEDLRNAVATSHLTLRKSVERYIAMLNAVDTALILVYDDLRASEKAEIKAALDKLRETVGTYVEHKPTEMERILQTSESPRRGRPRKRK